VADQRPVYAVADVHGRADLLESVVAFAESDAEARGRSPRFVFLGDIVDRGPSSRACIDLVISTLRRHPGSVQLRGNHDDWFLQDVGREAPYPLSFTSWLRHGGIDTLRSYAPDGGAGREPGRMTLDEYEELRRTVREEHPGHVELFRNAPLYLEDGPFLYVHAGIEPGIDLAEQDPDAFMWIRDEFLFVPCRLPRPVVHGHTIFEKGPIVTENRISLDTGAYYTGRLTTMIADPVECSVSFRQTDGTAARIVPVEPLWVNRGLGSVLDDVPALFESARPTMEPAQ